ncbi:MULTISPECIES: glycosyltransferase [unclassified Ectothiorhodospira]|uniref:glycosyltransferase n=1 Tax=unclassified Ectothiorhodospira TaxID=2684909 RepID=UPI001EE8404E|nr:MULTISPECIES: glycosyltransferase [unclassified Ectothiorhodospira]MCG5516954.1 glycosyltransferase [Ectothiorhodospira sp. 9100]MCG5519872.1 glycosyltransferase [Ectothiorhodospira sp. 9905]
MTLLIDSTAQKMKASTVWFILPKLNMGGIERNRLKVINQCLQWNVDVCFIFLEYTGELLRDIPLQVPVVCLGEPCKFAFFLRLAKLIRAQNPSCIISAFDDVNVMVMVARMLARSDTPVLLSNHSTFSMVKSECTRWKRAKYFIIQKLLPWAFKHAKGVVAVSEGVAEDLSCSLSFPRDWIDIIYNPVIDSGFHDRIWQPATHPVSAQTLLFVGRLVSPKGIPSLLAACALLKHRRTLDVLIVGDGPERPMIEAQVEDMGLSESVRLVGMVQNPLPLMAGSGVLVLPSRFEGLGNVLIEAMACGTQVISTDCPHGPSEILEGGRYGQLVPVNDPAALAAAIERSLDGEFWVEPEILRARASEFSVEKATRRYLELAGYDMTTLPPPEQVLPQTHSTNA